MKKTSLLIAALLIFAGISQSTTREMITAQKDKMPHGNKTIQTVTLCQRLACIADKLEISAKVSYWKKEYRQAIDFYNLLLKAGKSEYDDLYNLACCYGQMGDDKQAAKYLKLAVEEGFTHIDHINSDSDFEKVRNSPKFQKILKDIVNKLGQPDNSADVKAETTIQTAAGEELIAAQDDKN